MGRTTVAVADRTHRGQARSYKKGDILKQNSDPKAAVQYCAQMFQVVAGSASALDFGSDDRNAMISAATYGNDCTNSIMTQKRTS